MNIELTESMQKEIIKQVSTLLYAKLSREVDVKGIVEKARQEVVSNVISKAAGEFHKKINVENIVQKHIISIEDRINARIEKLMAKGINIKLTE